MQKSQKVLGKHCNISKLGFKNNTVNPLKPNDLKKRRNAQLTSRCYILYIYSTNTHTEYFKNAA